MNRLTSIPFNSHLFCHVPEKQKSYLRDLSSRLFADDSSMSRLYCRLYPYLLSEEADEDGIPLAGVTHFVNRYRRDWRGICAKLHHFLNLMEDDIKFNRNGIFSEDPYALYRNVMMMLLSIENMRP